MHPYQAHLLVQTADIFDLWKLIEPAYTMSLLTELSSTAHRNILSRRGHRRGVQTELARPWWLSKYRLATDEKASSSCCPIHRYHMKLKVKVEHRIKVRLNGIQTLNSQFQKSEREKRLQAQRENRKREDARAEARNKEKEKHTETEKETKEQANKRAKTNNRDTGSNLPSHGPALVKAEREALQNIKSNMNSGQPFTGLRQLPRTCQARIKQHLELGSKSRYSNVTQSTSKYFSGNDKAVVESTPVKEEPQISQDKTETLPENQRGEPTQQAISRPWPTTSADVAPLLSRIVPEPTSSTTDATEPESSADASLSCYTKKIPETVRDFMRCTEVELQESVHDEEAFRRLSGIAGHSFIKNPWDHIV